MTTRRKLAIASMLLLLAGAWILVVYNERADRPTLRGALQLWADVIQDVDNLRLRFAGSSDRAEMETGERLAFALRDKLVTEENLQAYVRHVGGALTPHVRRKAILYRFNVVDLPSASAFAFPGGHVYVTRQLLDALETEAELAGVLAQQIADVDLRYCMGRFQNQAQMEKLVSGDPVKVAQLAYGLIVSGPSTISKSAGLQDMDAHSIMLVAQARYHPKHLIAFENRKREKEQATEGEKTSPRFMLEELASALSSGVESYLTSAKMSNERISEQLRTLTRNESSWSGKEFYSGRSNHSDRISRADSERRAEWRIYEEPPAYQVYRSDQRYGAFKAIATDLASGFSSIAANRPTPEEATEAALSDCQKTLSRCAVYGLGDRIVLGKTNEEMEEEKAIYFNAACRRKPVGTSSGARAPNAPSTSEGTSNPDQEAAIAKGLSDNANRAEQTESEPAPKVVESQVEIALRSFLESPARRDATFMVGDISFAPGGASITEPSLAILQRVAALLTRYPKARIAVGILDGTSSAAANALSDERSRSIRDALVHNGVAASQISIKGERGRRRTVPDASRGTGVWISVTPK